MIKKKECDITEEKTIETGLESWYKVESLAKSSDVETSSILEARKSKRCERDAIGVELGAKCREGIFSPATIESEEASYKLLHRGSERNPD